MTKKCEALKKKVKSLKDKNDGNHQHCQSNARGSVQCYSKKELNVIIGKSIKDALKKECCDCAQDKEHNAINVFDALSLSSSDSNDISCT
eukprot:13440312-Ditylum_brightwellii.AAC.1